MRARGRPLGAQAVHARVRLRRPARPGRAQPAEAGRGARRPGTLCSARVRACVGATTACAGRRQHAAWDAVAHAAAWAVARGARCPQNARSARGLHAGAQAVQQCESFQQHWRAATLCGGRLWCDGTATHSGERSVGPHSPGGCRACSQTLSWRATDAPRSGVKCVADLPRRCECEWATSRTDRSDCV